VHGLRPRQHSLDYTGDGFYRSQDPTNSIKVLKKNESSESSYVGRQQSIDRQMIEAPRLQWRLAPSSATYVLACEWRQTDRQTDVVYSLKSPFH